MPGKDKVDGVSTNDSSKNDFRRIWSTNKVRVVRSWRNMAIGRKILFATTGGVLLTLIGASVGAAATGFSGFNSQSNAIGSIGSATVGLNFGSTQTIDSTIANLIPGDQVQEPVTITNTGTVPYGSVEMSVGATDTYGNNPPQTANNQTETAGATVPSTNFSFLNPQTQANDLALTLQQCSVAWTAPTSAGQPYTCSGTETTSTNALFNGVPATAGINEIAAATTGTTGVPSDVSVPLDTLGTNSSAYMLFTWNLPEAASNYYANQSLALTTTFVAVQPTGSTIAG